MSNNPLLFNSMIAGATGGCQQRCITSSQSSTYTDFEDAVVAFCTALDADIATLDPPASVSDCMLMQSIVQGVLADRLLVGTSTTAYAPMIDAIRTLWTLMRGDFDGSGNPSGGWEVDSVGGLSDTLTITTGYVVIENPSDVAYVASLTDVSEDDYIMVEAHFVANRLDTNTNDVAINYRIEVRYDGGTWTTLWTTNRSSFPAISGETNYVYCPIDIPKTLGSALAEPVPEGGAALAEFRLAVAAAQTLAWTIAETQGTPQGNLMLRAWKIPA